MKTIAIYTLGCKVNQYESEAVLELFERAGYTVVPFDGPADVYLINTCTVTAMSDRKSRQMIRRAKHHNPHAVVAVMGCYAQTAPEAVSAIPDVDIVMGNRHRDRLVSMVEAFQTERQKITAVEDIMAQRTYEPLTLTTYDGRTRAYLKVQDGCDRYCSYCIIPYARGPVRSRPVADAAAEAEKLANSGFSEVVLTGIHVASYGKDQKDVTLLDLLRAIHDIPAIARIRLGSLEPRLFTDAFVKALSQMPKVCPHFHLSLQSGCDETLARMNRRYTTADYRAAVARLRQAIPDVAITTDIIAGFPGETDAEFAATCAFVAEIAFADAHVFPFSVRKGTRAETMPDQVPPAVKEERAQRLIALAAQSARAFRISFIGRTLPVLFEQRHHADSAYLEGKTGNYMTVLVRTEEDLTGQLRDVRLEGMLGDAVVGTLLP